MNGGLIRSSLRFFVPICIQIFDSSESHDLKESQLWGKAGSGYIMRPTVAALRLRHRQPSQGQGWLCDQRKTASVTFHSPHQFPPTVFATAADIAPAPSPAGYFWSGSDPRQSLWCGPRQGQEWCGDAQPM